MFFDFDKESNNERSAHLLIMESRFKSLNALNKWIKNFINMKFDESDNNGLSVYIIPNRTVIHVGDQPLTFFYAYPSRQCDILIDYSVSLISPYNITVTVIMKNRARYLSKDYPEIKGSMALFKDISILNV